MRALQTGNFKRLCRCVVIIGGNFGRVSFVTQLILSLTRGHPLRSKLGQVSQDAYAEVTLVSAKHHMKTYTHNAFVYSYVLSCSHRASSWLHYMPTLPWTSISPRCAAFRHRHCPFIPRYSQNIWPPQIPIDGLRSQGQIGSKET